MSATTTTTTAESIMTETTRAIAGDRESFVLHTGDLPAAMHTNTLTIQRFDENPPWWPTDHRRMPDYRQVQYHPEWRELSGNSLIADAIIILLFRGCELLVVSNSHIHEQKRT